MKIAQISDLHIAAEGKTFGVAPMAENLARVVADINTQAADLVLVSGDITNSATVEEAKRAAKILAALEAPYFITPGNHDDRSVLKAVFPASCLPAVELTHSSYVVAHPELRLIALDSTDPDASNGRICPRRAAWLEHHLAESSTPTLIFMHHPPMKCGVEETDSPPLEGAGLLADIIARHPHILRILCGHIHLSVQVLWQGRLVCSAPSLGMRLNWSPSHTGPSRFLTSAPAYLWHMHNADGDFLSRERVLDDPDGPFDF